MKTKLLSFSLVFFSALAASPLFGATTTYTLPSGASGSWESPSSEWGKAGGDAPLAFPNRAGDIAQYSTATTPATIALDLTGGGPITIGKLGKTASGVLTINAGTASSLVFDNTGGTGNAAIFNTSGSNSMTVNPNITIANADLELNATAGITINGNITATTSATLTLNPTGSNQAVNISGSIGATGSSIVIVNIGGRSANTLPSATISGNLGVKVTSVTQSGSGTLPAILTLSGDNSAFVGGVFVTAGTLSVGSTTALSANNLVTLSGGTFSYGNQNVTIAGLVGSAGNVQQTGANVRTLTIAGSGDYIFNGTIAPTAQPTRTAITVNGAGTQTLGGDNTYAGATTITSGTLLVNNSTGSATGTGAVGVNGGTLGGGNAAGTTGFVGGLVTLASGAHIAPGMNAAGTLTLQSGLTLNSIGGSILDFELGATSDLLKLTGGTFTGNSSNFTTVNIFSLAGLTATTYTLIDWTGAAMSGVDAGDFALGTTPGGFAGTFSTTANSLQLTVSAVPEPSTWVLLAFSLTTVIVLRRRRA